MLTTTNLQLKKPELTDVPDITAFGSNWDTLDDAYEENEQAHEEILAELNAKGGGFIQYTGTFPSPTKPDTLYAEVIADYDNYDELGGAT